MDSVIKNVDTNATESVCPVCLGRIPATRLLLGDEVFQVKECAEHGYFKTLIWRSATSRAPD